MKPSSEEARKKFEKKFSGASQDWQGQRSFDKNMWTAPAQKSGDRGHSDRDRERDGRRGRGGDRDRGRDRERRGEGERRDREHRDGDRKRRRRESRERSRDRRGRGDRDRPSKDGSHRDKSSRASPAKSPEVILKPAAAASGASAWTFNVSSSAKAASSTPGQSQQPSPAPQRAPDPTSMAPSTSAVTASSAWTVNPDQGGAGSAWTVNPAATATSAEPKELPYQPNRDASELTESETDSESEIEDPIEAELFKKSRTLADPKHLLRNRRLVWRSLRPEEVRKLANVAPYTIRDSGRTHHAPTDYNAHSDSKNDQLTRFAAEKSSNFDVARATYADEMKASQVLGRIGVRGCAAVAKDAGGWLNDVTTLPMGAHFSIAKDRSESPERPKNAVGIVVGLEAAQSSVGGPVLNPVKLLGN